MPHDCLDSKALLTFATGRMAPEVATATERHLANCPRCRAEAEQLRSVVRAVPDALPDKAPLGPCLDEVAIAALVDGALEGAALREGLAHIETCWRCRREYEALSRLLDEPEIRAQAEARKVSTVPARRWTRIAGGVGIAAAAVLVVTLVIPRLAPPTAVHRDSTITSGTLPRVLEPVGEVTSFTGFRWQPVADADRHEVVLYSEDGTVLWEATTTEDYVVPPDSVHLQPGNAYFWRVRARIGFDQWSESPLHRFTLRVR
jgi:anti-sigma factor RsiW